MKTKYRKVIESLLDDLGVQVRRIEHNSKHVRITIFGPLGSRILFTGATPSHNRWLMNFKQDVRRMMREIGFAV